MFTFSSHAYSLAWASTLLGVASIATTNAQTPAPAGVQVSGVGLAQPAQLNTSQLAKLPRLRVTRPDHDGKSRTYSGYALYTVLTAAGAKLGPTLPGKGVAHYVLATAADGYKAVFALPELDPAFATRTVLLADQCDGKPLPADAGPYQIIVPDEKKMGRCVRQLQALRIMAAQP